MPNDSSLLDPELRQRQRRRLRLLKIGGCLLLVLVLGAVIARPTRSAIKGWQARRHAEKALRLIDEEKWNDATAEARAAYQLRPGEPEAIRAFARLLSRTRQTDALNFWKALRNKQPLTREDLRDLAAVALFAGDLPTADGAINDLSGPLDGGPQAADYLLAAQVAAQKGARDPALAYLEKVAADPRASERQQLNASLLTLALVTDDLPGAKEKQGAAWSRLTKIARGRSDVALDALVILAQRSLSAPHEIVSDPAIMPDEELIRALQTHPLSRAPQQLIALDLQMHLDPAQRDPLIGQAIARWRGADNESLAALARWLNSKGEFHRELDTIPLERALQTRELFLQRLDALGALSQWAEVKRLLSDESSPLDPVAEHMYLARCNQQLGEITAGENNWQRALEATGDDPQKLLTLADYAEKNGATKIAGAAYDTAAHDAPRLRPAQQGRLRLAQQSRDTRRIHSILAGMLKQWPNDTAIQNDEAYTRLLLLGKAESGQLKAEIRGQKAEGPGKAETLKTDTLNGGQKAEGPGKAESGQLKAEIRGQKDEVAGKADNGQLTTEIGSPAASPNQLSAVGPPQADQLSGPSPSPFPSQLSAFSSQLSEIEALAEDLVQREPASLPHRTLLALARLKNDRAAAALEIYDNLRVPPNAATPSAVAVHAAVLAANGREEDARTEAGAANWDQLLPEEQALIEALR